MIRSMTGYGQGAADLPAGRLNVELRTVNNRHMDLRLRGMPELGAWEGEIRRRIGGRIRRGRVEASIKLERLDGSESRPTLNRVLLEELTRAVSSLRDEYQVEGRLDLKTVVGIPGMFRSEPAEEVWGAEEQAALNRALDDALDALDADRRREGAGLQRDLLQRVRHMRSLAAGLRKAASPVPARLRDRLIARLEALAPDVELDAGRVEQEAALLADRSDVTEEIVRLEAHLEQVEELLREADGQPLGKRLEFLMQETFRETNTVSSKSPDLELTRGTLELKAEAEKVREQVQNLE
jgi:uncharacterized protein (TIGR00255 family)